MLDRDGGYVDAEHAPGLARVIAGGAHHVFATDLTLGGGQAPLAGWAARRGPDLAVLMDLGTAIACALAQGHGQVGRGDMTIVRMVERADDARRVDAISEIHQRP